MLVNVYEHFFVDVNEVRLFHYAEMLRANTCFIILDTLYIFQFSLQPVQHSCFCQVNFDFKFNIIEDDIVCLNYLIDALL